MNDKRPRGRPRSPVSRTVEVRFFLTREDADWFENFAKDMKFRGRSHLFTVMAERLREGGFAPAAFLVLGLMLGKRADTTGARKPGAGFYNPLKGLLPLPDPEEPDAEEIKQEALRIAEAALTLQRV